MNFRALIISVVIAINVAAQAQSPRAALAARQWRIGHEARMSPRPNEIMAGLIHM